MKHAGGNDWNESLLEVISGKRIINYLYFSLSILFYFLSSRLSTVLMVFLQITILSPFQVLSIMPVPQFSLLRPFPCFLHPFPSFLLHAAIGEFFKLQICLWSSLSTGSLPCKGQAAHTSACHKKVRQLLSQVCFFSLIPCNFSPTKRPCHLCLNKPWTVARSVTQFSLIGMSFPPFAARSSHRFILKTQFKCHSLSEAFADKVRSHLHSPPKHCCGCSHVYLLI